MNRILNPVWRLTSWYVLIIMVISLMFSTIIYRLTLNQVRLGLPNRQHFIEIAPHFTLPLNDQIAQYFEEQYQEVVDRLRWSLILLNAGVLVSSSVASYFLAKRTLRPIEQALDDQRHFTADASHELRTPLAAIKTEIEVAMKSDDHAEHVRVLSSNLEEVNRLEKLSTSLLHLARHEDEQHPMPMGLTEMTVVVDEALMRVEPVAKKKHITIEHGGVMGIVNGNQSSLSDLLVILLDNAIKYSPEKSVVSVQTVRAGKQLKLSVVDHGAGIASTDLPHVFNRFYRTDASRTKNKANGFGLGLAIAKQIVERHSGSIDIDSMVDEGTTVTVSLPHAG